MLNASVLYLLAQTVESRAVAVDVAAVTFKDAGVTPAQGSVSVGVWSGFSALMVPAGRLSYG
jgi:hypothetical protein